MKTALLVIGHGSRSGDAVKIFNQAVERIREIGSFDFVEGAHMEHSKPGIEEAVNALALKKPERIIIAPYFLYEGMHIKRDIPEAVGNLSSKYPEIEFMLAKPIGYEPVLADIIVKRADEALQTTATHGRE